MSDDPSGRRYRREETEPDRQAVEGSRGGARSPEYVPFGWPNLFGRGTESRAADSEPTGSYGDEVDQTERDTGRLDEGVAALLVLVGVALILFPEPVTSALGVVLAAAGVVAWLAERAAESAVEKER